MPFILTPDSSEPGVRFANTPLEFTLTNEKQSLLFNNTYWRIQVSPSLGGNYVAFFHDNGTFTYFHVTTHEHASGTYYFENDLLFLFLNGAMGDCVRCVPKEDGFVSLETFDTFQAGDDGYPLYLMPDDSQTYDWYVTDGIRVNPDYERTIQGSWIGSDDNNAYLFIANQDGSCEYHIYSGIDDNGYLDSYDELRGLRGTYRVISLNGEFKDVIVDMADNNSGKYSGEWRFEDLDENMLFLLSLDFPLTGVSSDGLGYDFNTDYYKAIPGTDGLYHIADSALSLWKSNRASY